MIKKDVLFKGFVMSACVILTFFSCVPIRKQLVVGDKNKRTLKQKQMMDTTVSISPYIYKIHSGDILSVQIKSITPGEYRLDQVAMEGAEAVAGYVVNDSGYIDVPVIGMVKVSNMTVNECRDSLKIIATQFLNNVVVNVKFLSFEVAVVGELSGRIKSPDGQLNILQALAQAGWSKEFANLQRVKIIRELENNQMHVYYVDVTDVGIISKPEFYLMPRDIVAIEPRKVKNFNNTRNLISFGITMVSVIVLMYNLRNVFK